MLLIQPMNESFPARSGWVSTQAEPQTSDIPIKLRVPNPKGLLRVGMTVELEIYEQPVEGIAIPEIAVTVNEEGRRMVTVIREEKAVPTEIKTSLAKVPDVRVGGWIRGGLELRRKPCVTFHNAGPGADGPGPRIQSRFIPDSTSSWSIRNELRHPR
jgi:hypothetical protein